MKFVVFKSSAEQAGSTSEDASPTSTVMLPLPHSLPPTIVEEQVHSDTESIRSQHPCTEENVNSLLFAPPSPSPSDKPLTFTVKSDDVEMQFSANGESHSCSSSQAVKDEADDELGQLGHRRPAIAEDDEYVAAIAKRGRLYATRHTRRLVRKNGDYNITSVGVTQRRRMFLADMFTTLVEMQWRYHVVLFATQFVVTWLLFGIVYYVIAVGRGDAKHVDNATWVPCVNEVYDYASALLFSVETQTTIGYGVRVINPVCQIGMFVLMLQSCTGTFVQVLATGLVFAKISRPKGRAKTILFSRNAVICQRDNQYQLMFRVGDMRTKSHIIGTSIRALMVRNRMTSEGELIPMCQCPLPLDNETSPVDDIFLFMVWPVTVIHKIDESSPLWDVSAEQLVAEQFEIIVILEGTVESTGSTTQVRTSYLPSEIYWAQRLAPLITYHQENGMYTIDYEQFHDTLPVKMPECSAKVLTSRRKAAGRPVIANDYGTDFTTRSSDTRTSQPAGLISKIFRRRSVVAMESQRKIQQQGKKEFDEENRTQPSLLWTVADPCKPVATLERRPSQPQFDVHLDGNNNNSVKRRRKTSVLSF